jgi:hypothetical protein
MDTTLVRTTTKTTESGCGCSDCGELGGCGDPVGLERTRFFSRQLVAPSDLTQDQRYFREKHRRHNRMLHGWGIVCGACVVPGLGVQTITVTQGYVLGPQGDEIVIDRDVPLDLSKQNLTGALTDPCAAVDPWCTDVRIDRTNRSAWLVVRYAECDTRPVQVNTCGCGCDDTGCENSRTRDSFELRLLDDLPGGERPDIYGIEPNTTVEAESAEHHEDARRKSKTPRDSLPWTPSRRLHLEARGIAGAEFAAAVSCAGRGRAHCPPCLTSPWVVLARVTTSASGEVEVVNDPYRRYVASFGAYFFQCEPSNPYVSGAWGREPRTAMTLIDTTERDTAAPPAASIAARTGDGTWVIVPGTFAVKKGETLGQLLAREGGRTFVDPGTGDAIRLRELYAAAGADPTTKITSVADALSPLEGERLDIPGLRVVRSQLTSLIDSKGVEQLDAAHGGSPAAAHELPATALRGIGEASVVGKAIAGKSVGEIAAQSDADFVASATKGIRGAARERAQADAAAVWTAATRVARLAKAWSG